MTPNRGSSSPLSFEKYFDVGGVRLRYRDEGRGPAAVFVHGWTLDLDMWEPQAEALASSCRIIRLDRRGYGQSMGRPSLEDDVTDLVKLARELELGRFALIGMSQGTRVALKLATVLPELITCLVLDGPPHIGPSDGPLEIPYAHYRVLAQTRGVSAFRSEWAQHPLTRVRSADPQTRALVARMIDRYPGNDLTDEAAPAAFSVDLQALAAHGLPTLVLSGEHDLASRKHSADSLALQLGGVQRAQIADAGHLCNLDNPGAYNRVLKDFFNRHAK
jgi:pimeloyl-ACP methyl ester carboxylesterase